MPIAASPKLERGRDIGRLVREPLYDSEELKADTTYNSVRLFTKPVGGTMNAGTTKTLTHTNLTQASQLGEPNQHLMMGLTFRMVLAHDGAYAELGPTAVLDYQKQLRARGVMKFGLSGKIFYELPLDLMPEGLGIYGQWTQAAAADEVIQTYGWPQVGAYYTLKIPPKVHTLFKGSAPEYSGYQLIDSTMPISCEIVFDPALVVAAANQVDIKVELPGIRLKTIG